MSVGHDYKNAGSRRRRGGGGDKEQVRSRGLLVFTLILIAAFASGLAYIKTNQPDPATLAIAAKSTATVTPTAQTRSVQSVKPKYDFYTDLPQRKLILDNDELERSPQRELESSAEKKPENAATQAKTPASDVKLPALELISNRRDSKPASKPPQQQSSKPAPKPQQTAATRSGGYVVQAGAYSKFSDADQVRAKLALLGIEARIEKGNSSNRTVHRVRIGPLTSAGAKAVRQRLDANNVPSIAIKTH